MRAFRAAIGVLCRAERIEATLGRVSASPCAPSVCVRRRAEVLRVRGVGAARASSR